MNERWEKILSVTPDNPDGDSLHIGADTVRQGGVIVFPTQCLYGLGADAQNAESVDRIFRIKQRPPTSPLLILIPDVDVLSHLATEIPPAAIRLMERFWPGNVTLIFNAAASLPIGLTAGTGKIGVRPPLHPVAKALVREIGRPITGTSANLSGFPGCVRIAELAPQIVKTVDLILDAGPLKGGIGSTIVDVTVTPPRILREGIVPATVIADALK